ncbi:MAG: hypothetical protein KAJ12_04775 [Bacteroidetes bacterium]|nr:hypothetical protein [Bacteroidota bacterium]
MVRTVSLIAVLAIVALSVTLPTQAVAQGRGGGMLNPDRINKTIATLTERLSLSDKQAESIREIMEQNYVLLQEDREAYEGDRETMMTVVRKRMKETDKKIMDLLSDDQKEEYQKYKEEQRENMRSRMRQERPQ